MRPKPQTPSHLNKVNKLLSQLSAFNVELHLTLPLAIPEAQERKASEGHTHRNQAGHLSQLVIPSHQLKSALTLLPLKSRPTGGSLSQRLHRNEFKFQ